MALYLGRFPATGEETLDEEVDLAISNLWISSSQ